MDLFLTRLFLMGNPRPTPSERSRTLWILLASVFWTLAPPISSFGSEQPATSRLIEQYCLKCHDSERKKGDIDLETASKKPASDHPDVWTKVIEMLRAREMPPEGKIRPSEEEYAALISWLGDSLANVGSSPTEKSSEPAITSPAVLVERYCANCHGPDEPEGGLTLVALSAEETDEHPNEWEKVVRKLQTRQMPPLSRARPRENDYESVVSRLTEVLDDAAAEHPTPGRTDTFRRLNRTEYQNAIRDLLALEIDAATLLPSDEASHGFDNVTVGTLSPTLLDRYISAAQKISRLAVGAPRPSPDADTIRIPADRTQEQRVEGLPLGTRGGALVHYTFPRDGEYEIKIRLARDRNEHVEGLSEPHELEMLVDRKRMALWTIEPPKNAGEHATVDDKLTTRFRTTSGPHELGVTFLSSSASVLETLRQPYDAHFNMHRHPRQGPAIFQISISGPYQDEGAGDTPSRRRIFSSMPSLSGDQEACAEAILSRLMRQAYRRPVTQTDLVRRMEFYRQARQEGGFEAGIEMALSAILVSPEFLFRIERDPPEAAPDAVYPISDLSLASRLSFFLWSSIPDEELLDVAARGELSRPEVLEEQTRRMLADPRSEALASNFAAQWLYLRNLESTTPNLRLFPDFDDNLRQAFRRETERLFERIAREDRSVLELLKSDYTFLNERLAKHYEIPNVYGSRFREVALGPESRRGGLLRHGSILTVTSYATRTSPVLRGHWVLKNLLGTAPPPPPPNVPTLEENTVDASLSVRERLMEHRANPTCASCHDLMDPAGFALENFDAVGRWREFEEGRAIDSTGGLPGAGDFEGVAGLEEALLDRPELFVSTLTEKLLTFALGRGVETYDAPAVRKVVREARRDDYRFSSIITGIVHSVPFTMRQSNPRESL